MWFSSTTFATFRTTLFGELKLDESPEVSTDFESSIYTYVRIS